MRGVYKRLIALLAVLVLVIASVPASNAEAASKTKAKKQVIVKTEKELLKALKKGGDVEIVLKTNKKLSITLDAAYSNSGIKLVIDAPKLTFKNKGVFENIVVENAKKMYEYASGNSITVNADDMTFQATKKAEIKNIDIAGEGNLKVVINGSINKVNVTSEAKLDIEQNGSVGRVYVAAPAELAIAGKNTESVKVTVNKAAEGASIKAEVPVAVNAYANVDLQLEKGAEKTAVTLKNSRAEIKLENNTDKAVKVKDVTGEVTSVKKGEDFTTDGYVEKTEPAPQVTQSPEPTATPTPEATPSPTATPVPTEAPSAGGSVPGPGPSTPSTPTAAPTATPTPAPAADKCEISTADLVYAADTHTVTVVKADKEIAGDISISYDGTDKLTIDLGSHTFTGTLRVVAAEATEIVFTDAGEDVKGAVLNNLVLDAPKAHVESEVVIAGTATILSVAPNTFVVKDSTGVIDLRGAARIKVDGEFSVMPSVDVDTTDEVVLDGGYRYVNVKENGANVGVAGRVENITALLDASIDIAEDGSVATLSAKSNIKVGGNGDVRTVDANSALSVEITNQKVVSIIAEVSKLLGSIGKDKIREIESLEFNVDPNPFSHQREDLNKMIDLNYGMDQPFNIYGLSIRVKYKDSDEVEIVYVTYDMLEFFDQDGNMVDDVVVDGSFKKAGVFMPEVHFGGKTLQFTKKLSVSADGRLSDANTIELQKLLYNAQPGTTVKAAHDIVFHKNSFNGDLTEELFIPWGITLDTTGYKVQNNHGIFRLDWGSNIILSMDQVEQLDETVNSENYFLTFGGENIWYAGDNVVEFNGAGVFVYELYGADPWAGTVQEPHYFTRLWGGDYSIKGNYEFLEGEDKACKHFEKVNGVLKVTNDDTSLVDVVISAYDNAELTVNNSSYHMERTVGGYGDVSELNPMLQALQEQFWNIGEEGLVGKFTLTQEIKVDQAVIDYRNGIGLTNGTFEIGEGGKLILDNRNLSISAEDDGADRPVLIVNDIRRIVFTPARLLPNGDLLWEEGNDPTGIEIGQNAKVTFGGIVITNYLEENFVREGKHANIFYNGDKSKYILFVDSDRIVVDDSAAAEGAKLTDIFDIKFSGRTSNEIIYNGEAVKIHPVTGQPVSKDTDLTNLAASNREELQNCVTFLDNNNGGTVTLTESVTFKGSREENNNRDDLLVIPEGVTLKIAEGEKITLNEFGKLDVYGTLVSNEDQLVVDYKNTNDWAIPVGVKRTGRWVRDGVTYKAVFVYPDKAASLEAWEDLFGINYYYNEEDHKGELNPWWLNAGEEELDYSSKVKLLADDEEAAVHPVKRVPVPVAEAGKYTATDADSLALAVERYNWDFDGQDAVITVSGKIKLEGIEGLPEVEDDDTWKVLATRPYVTITFADAESGIKVGNYARLEIGGKLIAAADQITCELIDHEYLKIRCHGSWQCGEVEIRDISEFNTGVNENGEPEIYDWEKGICVKKNDNGIFFETEDDIEVSTLAGLEFVKDVLLTGAGNKMYCGGEAVVINPIDGSFVLAKNLDLTAVTAVNFEQLCRALRAQGVIEEDCVTTYTGTDAVLSGKLCSNEAGDDWWVESDYLEVPANVTLKFAAGSKLTIEKYGSIVVRGRLEYASDNIIFPESRDEARPDGAEAWYLPVEVKKGGIWVIDGAAYTGAFVKDDGDSYDSDYTVMGVNVWDNNDGYGIDWFWTEWGQEDGDNQVGQIKIMKDGLDIVARHPITDQLLTSTDVASITSLSVATKDQMVSAMDFFADNRQANAEVIVAEDIRIVAEEWDYICVPANVTLKLAAGKTLYLEGFTGVTNRGESGAGKLVTKDGTLTLSKTPVHVVSHKEDCIGEGCPGCDEFDATPNIDESIYWDERPEPAPEEGEGTEGDG